MIDQRRIGLWDEPDQTYAAWKILCPKMGNGVDGDDGDGGGDGDGGVGDNNDY